MNDTIDRVVADLRDQREASDPISQARKDVHYDATKVHETLDLLRSLLLDQTPSARLESDIRVAHGLVAGLVGPEKATRIIGELPELRRCLALDMEAAFDGDPAASSFAEIIASYPSAIAVSTFRIAHAFYLIGEKTVARIMSEEAHSKSGIDIHPGAEIGCHFFIDHGTGVVIGETAVLGNRVKLYHGVTLGAFSNRKGRGDVGEKRHPTIGDDVTIYPNATILGGATVVGEGSVIGGNTWLTRSVPAKTRVTLEPPRQQVREGHYEDLGSQGIDYDI